jgi:hypothetical protein
MGTPMAGSWGIGSTGGERQGRDMRLWKNLRKLVWWQQLLILAMVLLIVCTWLAVCLILASYL